MKCNYRTLVVRFLAVALTILSTTSGPVAAGGESDLLHFLDPALRNVGGTARIYYAANCEAEDHRTAVVFPAVALQPPDGAIGIAAIRKIFENDAHVAVTQDRSAMIRITIGSVSTAILQTKLPVLTLQQSDQYDALLALNAIESAPEVSAAARRLDVSEPPGVVDILYSVPPDEAAPHLPAVIQNVTVDEALDAVARTFKGIITYGICTPPNGATLFRINYYEGT